MKRWLIQVAAAFLVLIALLSFYEVADVDTNIDTGNAIANGLALLAFVWLAVASLGTGISFAIRVLRQRRG